MDSEWSRLWSPAIMWRAAGERGGPVGWLMSTPGDSLSSRGKSQSTMAPMTFELAFHVWHFPTFKQNEAKRRKTKRLWLQVWVNWNPSIKGKPQLKSRNGFFLCVCAHIHVCVVCGRQCWSHDSDRVSTSIKTPVYTSPSHADCNWPWKKRVSSLFLSAKTHSNYKKKKKDPYHS